jgi:hypothetical protein
MVDLSSPLPFSFVVIGVVVICFCIAAGIFVVNILKEKK